MDDRQAIELLNDMLTIEGHHPLTRLLASQPSATSATADELESLQQLAAEHDEHTGWLTEEILALHGYPQPPTTDVTLAEFHYSDIKDLLPRTIQAQRNAVSSYETALQRCDEHPTASQVVGGILARHKDHLRRLEELAGSA